MAADWFHAQLCLAIWNPALMNFLTDPKRRRSKRLFYKTMGIVTHDRALTERPVC